jgi:hypothetical protein
MASDRFGWNKIFRQSGSGIANLMRWSVGKEVPGGPLRENQQQAKQKLENEKPVRRSRMEEKRGSNKTANPLEKDVPKPDYGDMSSEENKAKFKETVEHLKEASDKDFSKGVSDASSRGGR